MRTLPSAPPARHPRTTLARPPALRCSFSLLAAAACTAMSIARGADGDIMLGSTGAAWNGEAVTRREAHGTLGWNPRYDVVGAGVYGGVVKRDAATGRVLLGDVRARGLVAPTARARHAACRSTHGLQYMYSGIEYTTSGSTCGFTCEDGLREVLPLVCPFSKSLNDRARHGAACTIQSVQRGRVTRRHVTGDSRPR